MPNIAQKIAGINKAKFKKHKQLIIDELKEKCKCRKEICPVDGKCRETEVIYSAEVKNSDGVIKNYIGQTTNTSQKLLNINQI